MSSMYDGAMPLRDL